MCEIDSHADTIVAGSNCVVLSYTGQECNVTPYRDDYESVNNVPIANVATAWQCPKTGQVYILVFHEALWMGDTMTHSLINPNQLRHYGVHVQDDPTSHRPLSIITEDGDFAMEMQRKGTIISFNTHTPTQKELESLPHIQLSSSRPWDPNNVKFHSNSHSLEEEVERVRRVGAVESDFSVNKNGKHFCSPFVGSDDTCGSIFNLSKMTRSIASMKMQLEDGAKLLRPNESPGESDVKEIPTFQSKGRHTDTSPEDLSQRWHISVAQAAKTLQRTTQKFLRSAVLPLSRRYRSDRMFDHKTLAGRWSTDTMDGRIKSLNGNRHAQVFSNDSYFVKIYPMDTKSKAGKALREFCREFGIPQSLTFDGSKEQSMPGTEFMKSIRQYGIDYHISEADLHNQNPVEGVIREIRKKLYRTMVRRKVPRQLWDCGVVWCGVLKLCH